MGLGVVAGRSVFRSQSAEGGELADNVFASWIFLLYSRGFTLAGHFRRAIASNRAAPSLSAATRQSANAPGRAISAA